MRVRFDSFSSCQQSHRSTLGQAMLGYHFPKLTRRMISDRADLVDFFTRSARGNQYIHSFILQEKMNLVK